ncbi:MAG: hypothetical protein RMK57_12570 [Bryobacterales bacterium]|nr:hypothetical protein [Bryobacteraceae bacterium]MDW8355350.1 hypothetical protein [Bryobacterales bacterium]
MRIWALVVALAVALPVAAQRHKLTINAETPEGQLLQQIGLEENTAKKLALLEQFVAQYPQHEAAAWVYAQMVPLYNKTGEHDKAMGAAERLLALDPEDVRTAHGALKAAEAKKDPEAVKNWAVRVSETARKVAQKPKPQDEEEAEVWKDEVEFAKQVDTYSEYALYAAALQTPDPRKKIDLIETLEQRNPQSQYVPQVRAVYVVALQQVGETAKAAAVAEKILETDQSNEDMLLLVADYYLKQNKSPEKVIQYAERMIELMKTKPKPEGVAEADWEKKKALVTGLGYWMSGVTHATQNRFAQADKQLREALPYIKHNDQLLAVAYFHLGVANYKLEKILDAIKFNQECIKIKSPLQAQAKRNLAAIQAQYRVVR